MFAAEVCWGFERMRAGAQPGQPLVEWEYSGEGFAAG